jgi:hypothetical protein
MTDLEVYYHTHTSYQHSHRDQFDHVGLTSIADRLVFLQDHQVRLNSGVARAVGMIRSARKDTGRLPVLCLDANPCDVRRHIHSINQHCDPSEYFVFSPDIRPDRSPEVNLAAWPSWLIMQQLGIDAHRDRPRQHRISMLSGSMRYHRLLLYRSVRDVIQDQDVVVINRMGDFPVSVPAGTLSTEEIWQWEDELPWTNRAEFVDHPEWGNCTSWQLPPDQGGNNHAAFAACVNITNETGPVNGDAHLCLLSEKTWKAYRSRCLVVNYGAPGARDFLSSVGLGIWSLDTQDHDYPAKIPDIRKIFQRDDIWDQYRIHHDMVDHNRDLVMSRDFALKLAQQFLEKIQAFI